MKYVLSLLALTAAVVASSAGAASYPTSAWDKQWLQTSISGDRFEIMGGKIALNKSSTPAVRSLGARLIKDHTKSLHEAVALAQRLQIKVPKDPTPSMQWELMMVSQLSGASFDYNYSKLEVYDHSQDIQESKAEASEGSNRLVRMLAHKDVPMLQTHFRLSRHALASSPAPGASQG